MRLLAFHFPPFTFTKLLSSISPCLMAVWNVVGIYLIWVTIHWTTVQLYTGWCVPATAWGLVFGASVGSQMPHCKGVLWLITNSSTAISNMWMLLGGWFITYFAKISISTHGHTKDTSS